MKPFTHTLIHNDDIIGKVRIDTARRSRYIVRHRRRVPKKGGGTRRLVSHLIVWEFPASGSSFCRAIRLTAPVGIRTDRPEFSANLGLKGGGGKTGPVRVRKI